ncbi:MAG: septal ring lytic transglycosylase RlpA family protein [Aeromicrobium sp.]|nr:septal ring lytic transglycosylase RlpA family protein [Burkholderiales bacterium]
MPLPANASPLSAHQHHRLATVIAGLVLVSFLAACSSAPKSPAVPSPAQKPAPSTASKPSGQGGYYLDDGPGADAGKNSPAHLDSIADAVPHAEKFHSGANKPYTVFGRSYAPVVNNDPFRQSGIASWYGRKFHGNMTSNGEIYDMYAMTAAHPTLPLPSYVRVTNPANAKSVVVRVNDRGPFHSDRIIDLSYAAAHRLDIARRGSAQVTVERVFAGDRSVVPPRISPPPVRTTTPPPVATAPIPTPTVVNTPPQPVIATSPITADGTQLFLQLGAFSSQENANIFRDRMARELDWNREPIIAVFKDGLWRVRLGPYTTRIEAEAIQARVKQSHDFSPVISKP